MLDIFHLAMPTFLLVYFFSIYCLKKVTAQVKKNKTNTKFAKKNNTHRTKVVDSIVEISDILYIVTMY